MFNLWLAFRSIKSKKNFNLTAIFSILGLSLGVASLVVSMVILTSYFGTLKKTVIDIYGHINMVRNLTYLPDKKIEDDIPEDLRKDILHITPFLNASAVSVHNGKMSAVFIQGFDPVTVNKVLNLKSRSVKGDPPFSGKDYSQDENPPIWVGKRLAEKFNLKVGENLNLVVPTNNALENFDPKVQQFNVKGTLSFGRYDYDLRYLITNVKALKEFADLKDRNFGYRIKIKDSELAPEFSKKFNQSLGSEKYWASSWRSINSNLFAAVDFEKWIIFFVMMIIIVVASFNVASTLFVNVLRQFKDIAVLKSLGLPAHQIKRVFLLQGMIIGLVGYTLGLILGFSLCYGFVFAQEKWNILNSKVYKLESLTLSYEVFDLFVIAVVCLLICFLATLVPAAKGGHLEPMKGFGYE